MVKIQAEVVNGECPTCSELTMLVGLTNELYRCMNCGADLHQHVNGKITYLPVMTSPKDGATPFVKDLKKEVETGKHGKQKYVLKQGENKGKIV